MSRLTIHLKKNHGTSLVEMLIYAALLASILLVTYRYYLEIAQQKITQNLTTPLYQNATRLLFDFHYTLHQATQLDSPAKNQTSSQLTLNLGAITYQLVDHQLIKIENGESNQLTDGSVSVEELSFHHLGPSSTSPTIQIQFILQNQDRRASFQTAVTLP